MRALVHHGRYDVRLDTVPDPTIEQPRDAIIKVTSTAICGSDLHLYDGYIPAMEKGDILGHEFMGEVVEVGRDNKNLKVGDRVVVPLNICCGECFFSLRASGRAASGPSETPIRLSRCLATTRPARQMDDDMRRRWSKVLSERTSKTLDAPSWLWSSIVDLVGIHESSYLEHCRKLTAAA
jgi:hypothetical protein